MKRSLFTVGAFLFLLILQAPVVRSQQTKLQAFYAFIDSCDLDQRAFKAPLIGISASHQSGNSSIGEAYVQAVRKAGGAPVVIPAIEDGALLRQIISKLDGLLMTGGADVNPLWYGEEPRQQLQAVDPVRDAYELKLIKLASDRNIPILGICRGEQLINIAFGGTLYQDIPSQHPVKPIKHVQDMPKTFGAHTIDILPETQLSAIIGKSSYAVNSFHHQSVKDLAPGFRVAAYARDSVIEAIEAWPDRPILGVQWHPEGLVSGGDTTMLRIFRFLVDKAETYRKAKEIHGRILSVDSHTDTPLWFRRAGFDIGKREANRVNLPKMEEGMLDGVYLAAYIGQRGRSADSLQIAVDRVTHLIKEIHQQIENNKDLCGLAVSPADFLRLKQEGKKALFIGVENGYGIGKDLRNIARYREMGVSYITLCHSYDNDICDTSTHSKREWNGLSPFGREVVAEMNRQGVMIDLSHASEKTFWDVMELSKTPVICSHSSAAALCNHNRNLTDKQLKGLAENGGVIQLCLLNAYINKDRNKATLTDAINHIDHIVKVAGIDHVGIGSDFDGGGGITGCMAQNDFLQITVKLLERGYSEEAITKIWGGNLMRVLTAVQSAASIN